MDTRPILVTTPELLDLVNASGVRLIDVRSPEAYNGWRLRDECRGGHIPLAKSLPAKWTRYLDWPDIVQSKKIEPSDSLVVYGYDPDETEGVARRFVRAGFAEVKVYHDLVAEWCPNDQLPLARLPRYRHLVSARWLRSLLANGCAPEYDGGTCVVCHSHYQNRAAYEEGHIPGAIDIDTNTLESPDTWNRRAPAELKDVLERAGITTDTTVVLYGRTSIPDAGDPFPGSSAGQLGAMRCAFLMLYAGVKDVRVLNGGLQAWLDEGFEVSTADTHAKPVRDFGAVVPVHPELAIDLPEAKEFLRAPDKNLVCVRSWREYIGEVSGYNYIARKGRIPGAVFANCGSDAYHMQNYRNLDETAREYHEIEDLWLQSQITPAKRNAFYCGTGWRGAEAFFNAWLMGWPGISVYDGGWFEWSNDAGNPCETGLPEPVTVATNHGSTA